MSTQPFCLLPWFHQKVNSDGSMVPCCVWQPWGDKKPDRAYTHEDFFDGEFMQSLRSDFLEGRIPSNCSRCVYYETFAENSNSWRRLGLKLADSLGITAADPPQLVSQEVDLSNLCNLRCRMCGQDRSTKWLSDSVALGKAPVGHRQSGWQLTAAQSQTTKRLVFLGGEPMMHQQQICDALQQMEHSDRLGDLDLHFNTNLTIPLEQQLIDLIGLAASTRIDCSIDGYKQMNDYVRSDSEWPLIETNLAQLVTLRKSQPNTGLGETFSFSVYNAAGFHQFAAWWQSYSDNLSVSLVTGPTFLDARNLPTAEKKRLIDHYQAVKHQIPSFARAYSMVLGHLSQDAGMDHAEWLAQFRTYNQMLDQRRGTNLSDVYPQLAEIVG